MKENFQLEGVYPALPTPISEDGSINYEASENHIEHLADNGVQGVVPAGCTGHAASLGDHGDSLYDEHVEYVSRVADIAREHDLEVIAGDGLNTTAQTIALASRIEEEADIDAHLVITPYATKPTQDRLVSYYDDVAEALDQDIVAYNVPSRTGVNIKPETDEQLAEIDGVAGLKEASNDPEQIREIGRRLGDHDDFAIMSGDDPRNPLIYEVGGVGTISVTGNVAPSETVEIWEQGVEEGAIDAAWEMNEELGTVHDAMFQDEETNPLSVQYALNQMGYDFGTPRAPLDRPPHEGDEIGGTVYNNRSEIHEALDEFDLR